MPIQFLLRLSQNYIEILDDDEHYDITIEVGEDPNVKIFRAHMIILCYRSPFLRRTLASNKKNNNDVLTHIKFPNILPEIFHIILKYIYGGIISLNEHETLEILKVLIAADQLHLQELVDYLEKYLIKSKSEWIEQHFELTRRISFQSNYLLNLQKFCIDLMEKSPEKIFKSLDFTLITEKSLVSIIKKDYLRMKEIEIWESVLKWGIAQNSTIILDPDTWSDDDFKMMKDTLKNCLPLIRFFSLSSEDFVQKVRPYKKLLKHQLYEELLNSYLSPNSEPSNNILFPRHKNIDGIIDSKIVNLNIVSLISRWIDKLDIKSKFSHLRELYLPYKFKLLLRGSRDGFTPKKFHTLCDNIPHTVTFIKVKGTKEIIGGYNPSVWKNSYYFKWGKTRDSFIFSFKNENDFKNPILSHVKNIDRALHYSHNCGPAFGADLCLYVKGGDNSRESREYNFNRCVLWNYEKKLNAKDEFSIEDYEVFQLSPFSNYCDRQ